MAKNCPNIFEKVLIILLEPKSAMSSAYERYINKVIIVIKKEETLAILFENKRQFLRSFKTTSQRRTTHHVRAETAFVVALVTNSRMRTRYSALSAECPFDLWVREGWHEGENVDGEQSSLNT